VGIGPFPANTQTRAFVWLGGLLFNLGTLGGPDSIALFNNDRGQVAGISYRDDVPVPGIGGLPAVATFFWQQGEMRNIGNLGGHFTFPRWMNERGEIVGQSNLRDDQFQHAFIWTHGSIKDLGTLGGNFAVVNYINDDGVACGFSRIPTGTPILGHPFLWKNGHMRDLGPPPAGFFCAAATWVNEKEQAVGDSDCDAQGRESAFIAEYGLPPADLNPLVVPGADLRVRDAVAFNDRGEIACRGLLRNGDVHACLLIPVDREHEWDDDATAGFTTQHRRCGASKLYAGRSHSGR
jgi:probable HAF family extracellular repeat protein